MEINCSICNKNIEGNSQFINGKYYHNECIINIIDKIDSIKKICLRKRDSIEEMENFYKKSIINKGDFASEFHLLTKYDITLLDIIDLIEK